MLNLMIKVHLCFMMGKAPTRAYILPIWDHTYYYLIIGLLFSSVSLTWGFTHTKRPLRFDKSR